MIGLGWCLRAGRTQHLVVVRRNLPAPIVVGVDVPQLDQENRSLNLIQPAIETEAHMLTARTPGTVRRSLYLLGLAWLLGVLALAGPSWQRLPPLQYRPEVPPLVIALSCSYCRGGLTRSAGVYCASCLAPHHPECFAEHGRCSVMGCAESRVVRPAERVRPPRQ